MCFVWSERESVRTLETLPVSPLEGMSVFGVSLEMPSFMLEHAVQLVVNRAVSRRPPPDR